MNMMDRFFEQDLAALDRAEQVVQGKSLDPKGPYIYGKDIDWTDEKQAEELYEYGAEPHLIGRRG